MKKLLLFLCFFCSTFFATAQHYQCFQRDANVHWYVDSIGYQRAIRVDSVTVEGTDTVYYPFLSRRGHSYAYYYTPPASGWLGSAVHEKPNGNFLFRNWYNDTIIIKTQAGLGDSWIFYNDTSIKYYMATVTAVDTMTISGTVDSIKKVTINTYSPLLDTYDYVNNFSFTLSKYHGLQQAFDLYNFPYRSLGIPGALPNDPYLSLTQSAPIFHRFDFRIPTLLEMFDYHPGDAYEYHTDTYCGCSAFGGPEQYELDSIIYRSDPDPYHAIIAVQRTTSSRYVYCPAPYATTLAMNAPYVDTLRLDTSAAYIVHPLPEEDSQRLAYYYLESDTSFCLNSPFVRWVTSSRFEECGVDETYKVGLGLTYTFYCSACGVSEPVYNVTSTNLIYYFKNGVACMDRYPLAIKDVANPNNTFIVSPNPVADVLTITMLAGHVEGTYYLYNNLGQLVQSGAAKNKTTLDVSQIVAGLYYLTMTLPDGSRVTSKVVISH